MVEGKRITGCRRGFEFITSCQHLGRRSSQNNCKVSFGTQQLPSRVRESSRKAVQIILAILANEIILKRINSGEARRSEGTVASENLMNVGAVLLGIKDPRKVRNQNSGAKLLETFEQSREKLLKVYSECVGTILEMNSKDLIKLIKKLRSDPLLKRVLESLGKKRIADLYKLV
jgi:hypothetical protein